MANKRFKNLSLSSTDIQDQTYKQFFGGGAEEWGNRGTFQLYLLKKLGLKPQSMFLDIGCGPLRGGVHFIDYLDSGRYCGVDFNADLIKAGKKVIEAEDLSSKNPTVETVLHFEFGDVGPFDYALAFSVLNSETADKCFAELPSVMKVGGKVYITHARWFKKKFKPGGLRNFQRWFKKGFEPRGLPQFQVTNWIKNAKQIDANLDIAAWGWEQCREVFPVVELTMKEIK